MSVTSIVLAPGYEEGNYAPALDVTGVAPTNLVVDERQTFTANAPNVLQLFIPSYSPFFADSTMQLVYTPTGGSPVTLVYGVDYYYAFPFIGATRSIAKSIPNKAVYGAVVLLNSGYAGSLKMRYQTLGGDWQLDSVATQNAGNKASVDYFSTTWEQVAWYGIEFPPITQDWDRTDPTSVPDLIGSVLALSASEVTSLQTDEAAYAAALAHVLNNNNPHQDTADALDLDKVVNYAPATDAQAADPNNNTSYISPAQLGLAFRAGVGVATDSHEGLVTLNLGLSQADATDPNKPLTTSGFIRLVKDRSTPISQVFNNAQIELPIPNWPLTFPVTWQGDVFTSIEDLVAGWEQASGIKPIECSTRLGRIWLPFGSALIDLQTT